MTSPFQSSALVTNATGALPAASQYAQRKRARTRLSLRSARRLISASNPSSLRVWVVLEQGARDLLVSVCDRVDERCLRAAGCSFQECLGRLNFDL